MKQQSTQTVKDRLLRALCMAALCIAAALPRYAFGQCSAPTFVNHTSTSATCQSNGSITVGTASGGMGDYREYALYDAANSIEVRPWQVATLFSDLPGGSYTLRARYVCGVGFSPIYTKAVSIFGSYTAPNIDGITVQRRAQCNNGRIRVSATGGSNPKTYALVASLSAPEPVAPGNYIRPPRSSSIFDSLAAGAYYVRVYDACGSYATSPVTVAAYTQANPFSSTSLSIGYHICDTLRASLSTYTLGDRVTGTADTLRTAWVTYPDGSTDTLPATSYGSFSSFNIPFSKLGPVGPGHFPHNIGGSWPKAFQTGYRDACGNIFTRDYQLGMPVLSLRVANVSGSYSSCDSSLYAFYLRSTVSPDSLLNLNSVRLNSSAMYSLDSGSTWQQATVTSFGDLELILAKNTTYHVGLAYCGDTAFLTRSVPALSPLDPTIYESNQYACPGNTGIQFNAGQVPPVSVEMLSGPPGQAWVTDTLTTSFSIAHLTSSRNMLPGTYVFRFTDACGRVVNDTISTAYPYQPFDFDYAFPCGSTGMELSFTNDSVKLSYGVRTLSANNAIRAQIYRAADSTPAISYPSYFSLTNGKITIPGSNLASLPLGSYFVRAWKTGADSCVFIDKPWQKTASLASLSNSLTVSACPGTVSTGTVIAIAQGTGGGESYSLYQDTVSAATLVAGPQASAIFNGLNEAVTYIVTVSDTCGRGTQASLSFGSTPLPVYNNAAGMMPCPATASPCS